MTVERLCWSGSHDEGHGACQAVPQTAEEAGEEAMKLSGSALFAEEVAEEVEETGGELFTLSGCAAGC